MNPFRRRTESEEHERLRARGRSKHSIGLRNFQKGIVPSQLSGAKVTLGPFYDFEETVVGSIMSAEWESVTDPKNDNLTVWIQWETRGR